MMFQFPTRDDRQSPVFLYLDNIVPIIFNRQSSDFDKEFSLLILSRSVKHLRCSITVINVTVNNGELRQYQLNFMVPVQGCKFLELVGQLYFYFHFL